MLPASEYSLERWKYSSTSWSSSSSATLVSCRLDEITNSLLMPSSRLGIFPGWAGSRPLQVRHDGQLDHTWQARWICRYARFNVVEPSLNTTTRHSPACDPWREGQMRTTI